jgi:predicted Zn-dependent protease
MAADITPNARKFLEATPMKSLIGIPDEALDAVMAVAFQLYQAGRYAEVEVLCRGLSAADHTYWWSYSLHAATLRRVGKLPEALAELEKGLAYEPKNEKLTLMRSEIIEAIAREAAAEAPGATSVTPPSNPQIAA